LHHVVIIFPRGAKVAQVGARKGCEMATLLQALFCPIHYAVGARGLLCLNNSRVANSGFAIGFPMAFCSSKFDCQFAVIYFPITTQNSTFCDNTNQISFNKMCES
jgi:hypothetical protein